VQRKTLNLNVPYYVKIDFATTYKGDLRKLERQIEEDHIANLRSNCYKERSYSKPLFGFLWHWFRWKSWNITLKSLTKHWLL